MQKARRITLVLVGILAPFAAAQPATTTAPSTSPSTEAATSQPVFQAGVVQEIYALSNRPKRLREAIPGLAPKLVRVIESPTIGKKGDELSGLTGNVQVHYAGEIKIPATGAYEFRAEADDGMDLNIDDRFVLADTWINGSRKPSVASVELKEGWHPVRVRYYQGDGGLGLALRWKPPGTSEFVAIPVEDFRVSDGQVAVAKEKLDAEKSVDPTTAYRSAFRTQGFFELPEDEADVLVELLEGPTLFSKSARKDFTATTQATNFDKLPFWHGVKVLSGFLRGWYAQATYRGPVTVRAPYTLSDPEAVDYEGWHGAKRQGFLHRATIGEKTYTIYTPANDSPERENVAKAIAGLPSSLRILLNTVKVEPYGTASEFNGGGDGIWVRLKGPASVEDVDNAFSHEIGHLLMNHTDCYRDWEAAIAKDLPSVSHYGRLNPSEDFAEFVRLYLSTQGEPKQLASLRKIFPARTHVLGDVLKKVSFVWIDGSPSLPE